MFFTIYAAAEENSCVSVEGVLGYLEGDRSKFISFRWSSLSYANSSVVADNLSSAKEQSGNEAQLRCLTTHDLSKPDHSSSRPRN